MFNAEIEALRARIDELESLANDAYDVAAGILNPGIVDLAPPAPEQETFGGVGGGAQYVLGPLEYDSANAQIVQYMGTWAFTAPDPEVEGDTGSWSFLRAKAADGTTDLPPAKVYPVAIGDVLLKQTADGGVAEVGYTRMPILFPGDNFGWLQQKTAFVTRSVDYASPGSETGMGVLSHTPSKITYFSNANQVVDNPETLLTTITEEANEATVYEGA